MSKSMYQALCPVPWARCLCSNIPLLGEPPLLILFKCIYPTFIFFLRTRHYLIYDFHYLIYSSYSLLGTV